MRVNFLEWHNLHSLIAAGIGTKGFLSLGEVDGIDSSRISSRL